MAGQLPEDPLSPESIDRDFRRMLATDVIARTLWLHGKSLGWAEERIIRLITVAFFRRNELRMEEELRRSREGTFTFVTPTGGT
jgi:hypothetical protein